MYVSEPHLRVVYTVHLNTPSCCELHIYTSYYIFTTELHVAPVSQLIRLYNSSLLMLLLLSSSDYSSATAHHSIRLQLHFEEHVNESRC